MNIGRIFYLFLLKIMHGCVRLDIGLFVLVVCVNESAPYILKKSKDIKAITSSLLPLEYCSTDSRVVGYRTMSINNGKDCPHGTLYLCGKDSTERFIIETCQSVVECPPGTSHRFVVDPVNMTFELQCIPCDTGWFQPGFTSSSWFSRLPDHCGYQHKISKNISHNLVLYEQGTAIQETRWYCDIQNGFYEENGNMFCDDLSRKTCNCVHKFCQRGYLLRPDGLCVRCNNKLDPNKNFRCVHENRNVSKLSQGTSTDTSFSRETHISEKEYSQQKNLDERTAGDVSNPSTTRNAPTQEPEDGANIVVIVVTVGIILLVAAFAAVLWRYHNCSCSYMVRFFDVLVRRCNRSPRTDAGVPTGSTADQEELGEPHFNHIHTTDPNDVQEEHRNVSIDNAPTLNNSTTSNGNIIMNPSDERDLVPNPNQPEFIITSPKGDDNSGQQGSNLMMAVLKPDNESSVEMDSFDRSECSERAPLDSGLNTMEDSRYTGHPNFQQPDHQDIEEDGDDDAVENDSLLSEQISGSQTYRKQRMNES